MTLSARYRETVINRLSRFVIQPETAPVPVSLKNDVKVLLNALREAETKVTELTKDVPSTSTQFEGGRL